MKALSKGLLLALATLTIFLATGCSASTEDNLSERPWNAPKSWENGIPQGMMQGR